MPERKIQHGVVAILDGLGVRSDLSEAAVKFLDRRDAVLADLAKPLRAAEVFAWMGTREKEDGEPEIAEPGQPQIITFGDNIVLVWDRPKVTGEVLLGFSQPILHLIVRGMEEGLLLRGAVSFGEFILDGSTIVGPALSDAVSWAERADWIGVIATPKLGMLVDAELEKWNREAPRSASTLDCFYVRYPVPVKGGPSQALWTFPWPCKVRSLMLERDLDQEEGREHLLTWLAQCSIPAHVQAKFDNSLAFYDWYSTRMNRPPKKD